ncbi:MAG TPA: response regulator [Bacteroidota bacterium]|nr:response regulator [Bacteroidota bacterium]
MGRGKKVQKTRTVLLIDDEVPWLEAMSLAMQKESYKIITAESGEAAIKTLQQKKPDIILSDVRMPVMNGFDLFEQVRRIPKLKDVPFIFMSSLDDYDARKTAKELGADDYVEKPYDTEDVKHIVLDLLTRFKNKQASIP